MSVYPNDILVDAEWLKDHQADSNLRIFDTRGVSARLGHIPGAIALNPGRDFFVFVNGKMDVAPPEKIAPALAAYGVSNNSTVVLYDETNDQLVAIVYWMLRYVGHRDLKILRGGWRAWLESGGAESREIPGLTRGQYHAQANAEIRATADWIQQNAERERTDLLLLDARSVGEYARGHIPGAVNLPYEMNIDFRTMTFKDAPTLRAQLESVGATTDKEIVVYCHTGARSSHLFTTLELLGYPRVRNYFGSMADWSESRGLPITLGQI